MAKRKQSKKKVRLDPDSLWKWAQASVTKKWGKAVENSRVTPKDMMILLD
jgi:hypothetical protein